MKWLFDSSVLVAVFYADHVHHVPSARAFRAATKEDFCAVHTLAEVYATLTGLPVRPRITGAEGIAIIKQIRDRLSLVALDDTEYVSALESASEKIVGGAAYDALIAHCANEGPGRDTPDLERERFHSNARRDHPARQDSRHTIALEGPKNV